MRVRTVRDHKDSGAVFELESVTHSEMCFGAVFELASVTYSEMCFGEVFELESAFCYYLRLSRLCGSTQTWQFFPAVRLGFLPLFFTFLCCFSLPSIFVIISDNISLKHPSSLTQE